MPEFIPTKSSSSPRGDDEWRGNALILRGRRQALLASNLANFDTPGYQAKDINFAEALDSQLASNPELKRTSNTHMSAPEPRMRSTLEFAQYVKPVQPSLDGNTVDDNRERVTFTKNSILYEAALKSLGDELEEFNMASSDPSATKPKAGS